MKISFTLPQSAELAALEAVAREQGVSVDELAAAWVLRRAQALLHMKQRTEAKATFDAARERARALDPSSAARALAAARAAYRSALPGKQKPTQPGGPR